MSILRKTVTVNNFLPALLSEIGQYNLFPINIAQGPDVTKPGGKKKSAWYRIPINNGGIKRL